MSLRCLFAGVARLRLPCCRPGVALGSSRFDRQSIVDPGPSSQRDSRLRHLQPLADFRFGLEGLGWIGTLHPDSGRDRIPGSVRSLRLFRALCHVYSRRPPTGSIQDSAQFVVRSVSRIRPARRHNHRKDVQFIARSHVGCFPGRVELRPPRADQCAWSAHARSLFDRHFSQRGGRRECDGPQWNPHRTRSRDGERAGWLVRRSPRWRPTGADLAPGAHHDRNQAVQFCAGSVRQPTGMHLGRGVRECTDTAAQRSGQR